ncbi:MAG: hypothetical protein JXR83_08310 [Deltaproteobacteria bacterium]|nr:hypothetical protein [Deltaproteobacteria bacterium]
MRAAIVIVAASLLGCIDTSGPYLGHVKPPKPGHVRWCPFDPTTLDPAMVSLYPDFLISYQLHDGLVVPGPNSEPRPSLAESWEVSADQRVFTFHLRTDARFSNGRAITAEDVRYSMVRVLRARTAATTAEYQWAIRHAKAFNAGRARLVTVEASPFHVGDVVELVEQAPPLLDPDLRHVEHDVALLLWPDDASEVVGELHAGEEVYLEEFDQSGQRGYVFRPGGEGRYGWVPREALTIPNGELSYAVASLDDPAASRRTGSLPGKVLLSTPEIVGIRAPDLHTLIIETEAPTPTLLMTMAVECVGLVVPREAVARWPRTWFYPEHIVTSGAYHLKSWLEHSRLELARSGTFWDRDHVAIEHLVLDYGAGSTFYKYLAGQCDVHETSTSVFLNAGLLFDDTGRPRVRDVRPRFQLWTSAIGLNMQRLTDHGLRRALALALDVSQLSRALSAFRATGQWTPGRPVAELTVDERVLCNVAPDTPGVALIVAPGKLCYVPPQPLGFHPDEARAELAASRSRHGVPERIVINVGNRPRFIKQAEWAARQWQQNLGLAVEVRTQDIKSYWADPSANSDAFVLDWADRVPDVESAWLTLFRCGSSFNYGHFCSEEYERLFAQASQIADQRRRLELMRQAEEILAREVAVIPIGMQRNDFVLAKPYVQNVTLMVRDWRIDENWGQQ